MTVGCLNPKVGTQFEASASPSVSDSSSSAAPVAAAAPAAPAYASTYSVFVDPSGLTEAQITDTLDAVAAWVAAVPVTLSVSIGSCPTSTGCTICVSGSSAAPPADPTPGQSTAGIDSSRVDGSSTITIYTSVLAALDASSGFPTSSSPSPTDALFRNIATHELGHAMGLVHHDGMVLMNPTVEFASATLTADDVAQWRMLRGL